MEDTEKAYAKDEAFWNSYLKGRPQMPDQLFKRICQYHAEHGGHFDVVHDVGAGIGVHSARLAKHFDHVIVSDIVPENMEMAKERLGQDKYSYKVMNVEDANALEEGSVDMVYAATMMHFADFDLAFKAIAKQLKPGGTFTALTCGIATLSDKRAQAIWHEMWFEGIRVMLRHARDREKRLKTIAKSASGYNTMPMDERYFVPGALRITLNCGGKWPKMVPRDVEVDVDAVIGSQSAVGPNDKIVAEDEPGWSFKTDLEGLREQFATFPFAAQEPAAFESLWEELATMLSDGKVVEGVWPARILLATSR